MRENVEMFPRADVCHAGKKLLPQVPYGILALGNISTFSLI